MEEEWRIFGATDYLVSSFGRVKSLKFGKERILKPSLNSRGYYLISLSIDNISIKKQVHQLVAIIFLNHIPDGHNLVINHKDFNKLNNKSDNLEIVTNRENSNKKHIKSRSQYVGVSWHKGNKKWAAKIRINGKQKTIGYYNTEIEASNSYQNTLNQIL